MGKRDHFITDSLDSSIINDIIIALKKKNKNIWIFNKNKNIITI